jgi:AcrR family transcriptional regulator
MVNTRVEYCMATKPRKTATRRRPRILGREAWLEAARSALIEEGTAGIEINKLAKRLGVSRGGFYWFFASRDQLLDELLAFWVQTGTQLFERILRSHDRNGMREYEALVDLWIDEKEYDPKWDAAVRDWARTSAAVLSAVKAVDQKRIALLERLFRDMGYRGKEAHVRARITYYHQVGYYALGVQESRRERMELLPFYTRVLTGKEH